MPGKRSKRAARRNRKRKILVACMFCDTKFVEQSDGSRVHRLTIGLEGQEPFECTLHECQACTKERSEEEAKRIARSEIEKSAEGRAGQDRRSRRNADTKILSGKLGTNKGRCTRYNCGCTSTPNGKSRCAYSRRGTWESKERYELNHLVAKIQGGQWSQGRAMVKAGQGRIAIHNGQGSTGTSNSRKVRRIAPINGYKTSN